MYCMLDTSWLVHLSLTCPSVHLFLTCPLVHLSLTCPLAHLWSCPWCSLWPWCSWWPWCSLWPCPKNGMSTQPKRSLHAVQWPFCSARNINLGLAAGAWPWNPVIWVCWPKAISISKHIRQAICLIAWGILVQHNGSWSLTFDSCDHGVLIDLSCLEALGVLVWPKGSWIELICGLKSK